jgi:hypothetical protein
VRFSRGTRELTRRNTVTYGSRTLLSHVLLKTRPNYSHSCSVPCKCGLFHESDLKQRDQPEPWAAAARYSVGTVAVCTHRQQSPRASAARARAVWTHQQVKAAQNSCYTMQNRRNAVLGDNPGACSLNEQARTVSFSAKKVITPKWPNHVAGY